MKTVSQDLLTEIDRTIKTTWLNNIQNDWWDDALYLEASLKCAFYYHLRRKLASVLRENNLRIFSEYWFAGLRLKADLVIVRLKDGWKELYPKEAVSDVLAVIELKHTYGAEDWVKNDVRKFKRYLQEGDIDCQYYLGVIYDEECSALNWMDKRSTNHWANGRVTELDAGRIDGHMKFEVRSYNGMNPELSEL